MTYLQNLYVRALACSFVSLLLTLTYIGSFQQMLLSGDQYGTDSIASPFIPDTLLYLDLMKTNEWDLVEIALAGVKNAIVPTLLWAAADGDWYRMAVINAAIAFVNLVYVAKICRHFRVPLRLASQSVLLIGLLPAVWFFSVGSLKELPAMTALTGFLYHHLKGQRLACLLWGVLLVSIRFQLVLILPLFMLTSSFTKKPLLISVIALGIGSAAFPIFASFNVLSLDVATIYRDEAGTESNASAVLETLRNTVPGLSAVIVLIRVAQSVLEPLTIFLMGPFLFDEGKVSILGFAYLSTLLLTLRAGYRTVRNIVRGLRGTIPLDLQRLYALILFYGVPVGGFSFIHGRYMFPLTALVVLGAIWTVRSRSSGRGKLRRPLPAGLVRS